MGAEIGLPPMASIQAIAVIGNRASIWGDHMLAVCINSPAWEAKSFDEHWDESNPQNVTAHCTVRRQGGNPVKRTFSIADAEKAKLTSKETPWKGYPKRMLQMRARSWALRDAFPDVLKGLDCAEVVREYINIEADRSKKTRNRKGSYQSYTIFFQNFFEISNARPMVHPCCCVFGSFLLADKQTYKGHSTTSYCLIPECSRHSRGRPPLKRVFLTSKEC